MDDLEIHPVTPDRWDDVERLAGDRGFYSGCWCMWWRLSSGEWKERSRDERRDALQQLVASGEEPGLLAYRDGEPVGWVAVAPREQYERLQRSTKLGPVDEQPAWAIPCFYIHRDHRRSGVARALLAAAAAHAAARGGQLVEGFPIDTSAGKKVRGADLYTGTLPMFEQAGFAEVARRGGRPVVRRAT